MRIYRFERNGWGPYTWDAPEPVTDERVLAHINRHDDLDQWPVSWQDGIDDGLAIGCASIKALASWFDGMVGSLVRCGFRIRVYEIDPCYVLNSYSGKQVGFHPTCKKKVIR